MRKNNSNINSDDYMSITEFGAAVNRSYSRIHSLVAKSHKIMGIDTGQGGVNGPKWLIPKSEVEKFEGNVRYVGRPRISDRDDKGRSV